MSNPHLFHRLAEVRQLAGVSLRSISNRTGLTMRTVREQETSNDVTLLDLMRWKEALGVPFAELIRDSPEKMDEMTRWRAGFIQLMRSVRSLTQLELTEQQETVVRNMENELHKLMPELKDVGSWPRFGERRHKNEPSRVETQIVTTAIWCPELTNEI